jgi:putative transposase
MRLAYLTVVNTFAVLGLLFASDREKDTEILVLRHQVEVLERQLGGKKVRFTPAGRVLLAALLHRLRRQALGWMRFARTPGHGAALAPRLDQEPACCPVQAQAAGQ